MKKLIHSVIPIFTIIVIFGIFLLTQGANPIEIYYTMLSSTLTSSYGIGEVILQATPFMLVAVSTCVSAKAGLVNVGGEGQLVIGALFSTWAAIFWLEDFSSITGLIFMAVAGMLGGMVWSGIAGILKVYHNMNETITTVIMNYIAFNVVSIAVYGRLKDPDSFSWPMSSRIASSLSLPQIVGKIHIGFFIAIFIAVITFAIIKYTELGFKLRVIGGNIQAATHGGIKVKKIQLGAMLTSGAIAGLAGMIEIAGVEGRLRTTTGTNYGYLGFLAAWMAWNNPVLAIFTALLIGFLSVSGSVLEFSSGLPSSATQILMSLVLLAILWKGKEKKNI